ncbi:MAG: transcription elongation factor GreA [Calditrichaeota bacterium]|nr:transcription elongation factor GreA [Calditrichota bacterium]
MDRVYLTREGLERMRLDLENLLKVVRPEATQQLSQARELGDLSENAEYHAAREKLASVDRMIADLQRKLTNVELIEQGSINTSEVRIFSKVKLRNVETQGTMEWTLVDPSQANPNQQLISVKSPIGQGLLGKSVGDIAEIEVPAGRIKLQVEEIVRAEGI